MAEPGACEPACRTTSGGTGVGDKSECRDTGRYPLTSLLVLVVPTRFGSVSDIVIDLIYNPLQPDKQTRKPYYF